MWNLIGPIKPLTGWHADLTRIRRDLHAHPELGFEEHRTAALVAAELERYGVDEVHCGIGRTGVVGVIHGRATGRTDGAGRTGRTGQADDAGGVRGVGGASRPGWADDADSAGSTRSAVGTDRAAGVMRAIGLRADMDALPMREENSFAWRSTRSGLMHGCGHDGHTAMLLGAARYLASTRNFDGTVYCIFQPGEEGFAGAKAMIDDGLFERFPAEQVYAMHNWPQLPTGTIGVNPGPMMAAADRIEIVIDGRGGHGAHPHLAVDPVLVAGHVITAAQSVVARNVNPFDSAVVSLCAMDAGDVGAMSVIPRQARLVGTVRTFRAEVQDMVEQRLRTLCESVALGFGATADVHYERVYPATINSAPEAAFAADVAESLVGAERVLRSMQPSMGAEDFSFMLQVKPGAYLRIGQGGEGGCFLHNGRYDFNDEILPLGAALFASLAERAMPARR